MMMMMTMMMMMMLGSEKVSDPSRAEPREAAGRAGSLSEPRAQSWN